MGWWDEGIMGGDTPMDMQGCIDAACNVREEQFLTKALLDQHLDKAVGLIHRKVKRPWSEPEKRIYLQVLGYNVVTLGAVMPDALRLSIVEACEDEIAAIATNDEEAGGGGWLHPDRRVAELTAFIEIVQGYQDGVAVELDDRRTIMVADWKCGSCDRVNQGWAKFCGECGKAIDK